MYDPTDPRAAMGTAPLVKKQIGPFASEQSDDFSTRPPDEVGSCYTIHYLRAQNLLVAVVQIDGKYTFNRSGQLDEYVALTLDPITLDVTTDDGTQHILGNRLTIVPPGNSRIEASGNGTLTLLFSPRCHDIAAKCPNINVYSDPNRHVPAFQPWPDPPEGFKTRSYDLNIAPSEGRFGRIFRCTTMMINVLEPRIGPRDPSMVSPHHHDDFEQVSLALKGKFRHHLRWPWTSNMAHWRDDVAINLGSPSACVIPPPAIHTTLSTGAEENQLIDLFAPPRIDFSMKPGWVLNATDYPLPTFAEKTHD